VELPVPYNTVESDIDDFSKEVTIEDVLKLVDEMAIDDFSKEVQEESKFAPRQCLLFQVL
jgi:hypothetical protein